jgi:hypothetical protein
MISLAGAHLVMALRHSVSATHIPRMKSITWLYRLSNGEKRPTDSAAISYIQNEKWVERSALHHLKVPAISQAVSECNLHSLASPSAKCPENREWQGIDNDLQSTQSCKNTPHLASHSDSCR